MEMQKMALHRVMVNRDSVSVEFEIWASVSFIPLIAFEKKEATLAESVSLLTQAEAIESV